MFRVQADKFVIGLGVALATSIFVGCDEEGGDGSLVLGSEPVPLLPLLLDDTPGPSNFGFEGLSASAYAGYAVSEVGDFNGDGQPDYLIGAYGENRAYLVLGGPWLLSLSSWVDLSYTNTNIVGIFGESSGDNLGRSVSAAGDVNGDGLDDLIVGAYRADAGGADAGSAYIIFGDPSPGWARYASGIRSGAYPAVAVDGAAAGDYAGISVGAAGDFNGDGLDDVVIGAYGADPNGLSYGGRAYVVFGRASWTGIGHAPVSLSGLANSGLGTEISGEFSASYLGYAVSGAGDFNGDGLDDVVVGAYRASGETGVSYAGRAYVVYGRGSAAAINVGSVHPGVFEVVGSEASGYFGRSVAGGGDFNRDGFDDIVVGAPYEDPQGTSSGAAYVVLGGAFGTQSNTTTSLVASAEAVEFWGGSGGDLFGFSVAMGGDFNDDRLADVMMGAYSADPNGQTSAGRAYIAYGADDPSVSNIPVLAGNLNSGVGGMSFEGELDYDYAGIAVSFASPPSGAEGRLAMIGAYAADRDASTSASGRVYLTRPDPLSETYYDGVNRAPDTSPDVFYAGQGETLSVAAPGVLANDVDHDGDSLSVVAAQVVTTSGCTVDLAADGSVTASAPTANWWGVCETTYTAQDDGGGVRTDSLYVVYPELTVTELVSAAAGIVWNGEALGDGAGQSLDVVPDTNGDGLDDLLIGAYGSDAPAPWSGRTYVVHGFASAAEEELSKVVGSAYGVVLAGGSAFDWFGLSVASAGFFNHDLSPEILVSAIGYDGAGERTGRVYLVDAEKLPVGEEVSVEESGQAFDGLIYDGEAPLDDAGRGVAAGDVNGDGYDDVLIGAYRADSTAVDMEGNPLAEDVGVVYVAFGSGPPFSNSVLSLSDIGGTVSGVRIEGAADGDFTGFSLASVGDLNGDGYDELLIGAYTADNADGGTDSGRAYLVWGSGSFASTMSLDSLVGSGLGVVFEGGQPYELAGRFVANAGDINADGWDDLLIGAPGADDGTGCAYLVFGSDALAGTVSLSDLIIDEAGIILHGTAVGDGLGTAGVGLGDYNGDGVADFALGAPYADGPFAPGTGRLFVVLGGDDLTPRFISASEVANGGYGVVVNGAEPGDAFGHAIAGGGDVNGDGLSDVVAGAYEASPGGRAGAGRVYVVFGHDYKVIQ